MDKKGGEQSTEELLKASRRKTKLLVFIIIILVSVVAYLGYGTLMDGVSEVFYSSDETTVMSINSSMNETITLEECEKKGITNTIVGGLEVLVKLPQFGFWGKFLIFLGLLYLVQIILSAASDIFEVILVLIMGIWRGGKFIYRKTTKYKNKGEFKKT